MHPDKPFPIDVTNEYITPKIQDKKIIKKTKSLFSSME